MNLRFKKKLSIFLALVIIFISVIPVFAEEQDGWFEGSLPDGDYRIVVIPDTQNMPKNAPEKMLAMTNWIKDNAEALNIKFAIGVGDIINDNENTQWEVAKNAYDVLLGSVPFLNVVGNHDCLIGNSRNTYCFNGYFPYSTCSAIEGFGGSYPQGKMDNSYYFFREGNVKYMVLGLNYCATDDELAWANAVVSANPDSTVIVATHNYLANSGELSSREAGDDLYYFEGANTGDMIWEKFVKNHSNISMVVSGHMSNPDIVVRQDKGINNNTVWQFMSDNNGVSIEEGGLGMLMILTLSKSSNDVKFNWYSVDKNQFYKSSNQFTLPIERVYSQKNEMFDDFSSGLDAKTFSYSDNIGIENSQPHSSMVRKNRAKRTNENAGEIVYKTDTDITSYEVSAFLHNSREGGIPQLYVSADGQTYSPLADVNKTTSGEWGWRKVTLSGTVSEEGMRYFKVVLPDNSSAVVNYNPLLDSVKLIKESGKFSAAPPISDDFSGGLDAKTFSHSDNLKIENSQPDSSMVKKNRALRSDENAAELVYKAEKDITGYEVSAYLWNSTEGGTPQLYISANGEDYSLLSDVNKVTSGEWAYRKVTLSGTVSEAGMRYLKVVLPDTSIAVQNWNPLLDSVNIYMEKSALSPNKAKFVSTVAEALELSKQSYDDEKKWAGFEKAFDSAKAAMASETASRQEVAAAGGSLKNAISDVKANRAERKLLFDDFSSGLDNNTKIHSHSTNLKTETQGTPKFVEEKTRVLRTGTETAELVYKTEEDIAYFEVTSFLESWNQKAGLLSFYVSADGESFTKIENISETIYNTARGSGWYAETVAKNTGGIPSGMRYFKVVFAPSSETGVNWNPILNSVGLYSAPAAEIAGFAVLNSAGSNANGVLNTGKYSLELNINNLGESKTYLCAISLYDNNELKDIKTATVSVDGLGGSITADSGISVEAAGDITNKKIKAFVWDAKTLQPAAVTPIELLPAE